MTKDFSDINWGYKLFVNNPVGLSFTKHTVAGRVYNSSPVPTPVRFIDVLPNSVIVVEVLFLTIFVAEYFVLTLPRSSFRPERRSAMRAINVCDWNWHATPLGIVLLNHIRYYTIDLEATIPLGEMGLMAESEPAWMLVRAYGGVLP
jgi:hypothetical protein